MGTGSSGYLKMRGSDYIPMQPRVPPQEGSTDEDGSCSTHSNNSDEDNYDNSRRGKSRSCDKTDLDMMEMKPMLRVNLPPRNYSNYAPYLRVSVVPNLEVHTTALVHHSDPSSEDSPVDTHSSSSCDSNVFDGHNYENQIPYRIPRHKPARHKKGSKSNESVMSDTSSGFVSDYLGEDLPPPEYNLVMQEGDPIHV